MQYRQPEKKKQYLLRRRTRRRPTITPEKTFVTATGSIAPETSLAFDFTNRGKKHDTIRA